MAFRPLFYWKERSELNTGLEYLYPMGKYERTDKGVKSYLMPYLLHRPDDLTREAGEKREGIPPGLLGRNGKRGTLRGFFPPLRQSEEPVWKG